SPHTINAGGAAKNVQVHAGATNNTSAIADAGNVKLAPDAPTFSDLSTSGSLTAGNTYFYKITSITAGANATVSPGGDDVSLGTLRVASTAGFQSTGPRPPPAVR